MNGSYAHLVTSVTDFLSGGNYTSERLIANCHTIFNVTWSVFWCWQVTLFARIVKLLIPGETKEYPMNTYLDSRLISTPSLALEATREELHRMATLSSEMVQNQVEIILKNRSFKEAKEVWELEKVVNHINRDTIRYLKNLYNSNLTEFESKLALNFMHVSSDLERWGDHATNLFEVAEHILKINTTLTNENLENISQLFDLVKENIDEVEKLLKNSLDNYQQEELDRLYKQAKKREQEIDRLSDNVKETNINSYMCSVTNEISIDNAVVVNDILTNLERIGDHAYNIIRYFTVPPEKDKFAG